MDRPGESAATPAVAFDTDVLIAWFRGDERAKAFLARVPRSDRSVPSIVVMELLQACRARAENEPVRAFIDENFSATLYPSERIARRAEELLAAHAAAHGLRVADALIAATAIDARCTLATGNARHYRVIKMLELRRFRA